MSRAPRTDAPSASSRHASPTDRVRARWPRVRVDYVEILPCRDGQRVRLVVDLAGLTPADARVVLLPARAADGVERRLTSRRRYPSGCVLFEAVVPRAEPPVCGEWLACVRAAAGPVAPPALRRMRLRAPRLERAIGVIYRPDTERESHYFLASLPRQFDAVLHHDATRAVEPLERAGLWDREEVPETFPSAL